MVKVATTVKTGIDFMVVLSAEALIELNTVNELLQGNRCHLANPGRQKQVSNIKLQPKFKGFSFFFSFHSFSFH